MDEKALLEHISDLLEIHTQRMEETVESHTQRMEEMVDRRVRRMEETVDSHMLHMEELLQNHTQRIELKIENDVTKRIEVLFDGYKLTHEKQYELEREVADMKALIENLQVRILALENKTA